MNAEVVVREWIADHFPQARVVTETPSDMTVLPVVKVVGLGGPMQRLNLGRPAVDIEAYDSTRAAASTLADQIHDAMLFQIRGLISGANVEAVRTVSSPAFRPYDDTNLRRFGATYQIFLK